MFGRRPGGTLVTRLSTMRRFMPHVSPRRNDSLFYMMQEIEDGLYSYYTLELIRKHLEEPQRLVVTEGTPA